MMPRILAGLLIVLMASFAAGSLDARDDVEYGRYLGTRLRMYEEAYTVLDKIIKSGKDGDKVRARQVKAQVMKTEADIEFAEDESKRLALYDKAIKQFELDDDVAKQDPAAVVSKGVMLLELAQSLRRGDPDKAREYCDQANALLDAKRQHLDNNVRFSIGDAGWAEIYPHYSRMYFRYVYSFYTKSLTYELGSPDRNAQLTLCRKWLDEFQFALDNPTEELVLSYELMGDMELARGLPEAAAAKFVDLVNFLSGYPANSYIGRLALNSGYLRACELYTTELDFEPANLQKTVDLYAEAFNAYGQFDELDYEFKRFQLFRISALIKLGDEDKIRGAVDLLFKLAGDRDVSFRRQALVVLADIASRDGLDDELRWNCAGAVYGELSTNPISVILKNIQAYQSLLMNCRDPETFETYAPACFVRIGEMYSSMWRFLDATMIYREATVRTVYFRDKFTEESSVPSHMKDRCRLIKDGKSLWGFPGEMANEYARHAGFLVHPKYGEPGNDTYDDIKVHADEMKALLSGIQAQLELAYNKAFEEQYKKEKFAGAAVSFLSLGAEYRKYHLALYTGAKAYYRLLDNINEPRINKREGESEQWFQNQRALHATELGALPESMWKGVEDPHFDAILDAGTEDSLANWHKAVYYYKKYFLYQALRNWDDIKDYLKDVENPTIADGVGAIAQWKNAEWMAENPEGEGDPDAEMKYIGFAVYDLAYLLGNPPPNLKDEVRADLRGQGRNLALGLLKPFWAWFGNHLKDNQDYKRGALRMSFYAVNEAGDAATTEALYREYAEAFPEDKDQIRKMVKNVYILLLDVVQPKTSTMARVSSNLVSRSNLLKKNMFERISDKTYPDDAKKLTEAKTRYEKQMVLADHFWDVWIKQLIFDGPKNAQVREYLPDVFDLIKQKWTKMRADYPKTWASAMRAEFDKRVGEKAFKPIAAEAKKAVGADSFENNRKILDELETLKSKAGDDQEKVQKYVELQSFIELSTDALQFFTGTVFIYEFGGFLEETAADIDARSRPLTTRILKYYEEYRVVSGNAGVGGMEDEDIRTLGMQFYRIRDWEKAVKYLQAYIDKLDANLWGKDESVFVGQRDKTIGKTRSGEELELKYQLGKSYLELYKADGNVEDLKKAALLVRRCWCYNRVRDANELGGNKYKYVKATEKGIPDLKDSIEDYYLYIGRAMSEIFMELHKKGDVKVDWPKYHNQFTATLEQDKEDKLQWVPTNKAEYLYASTEIHLLVWSSFKLLSAYQFRDEFRHNLESWLGHIILWVETYKLEDKGVPYIKEKGVKNMIQEAYNWATTEGSLDPTFLPQNMKDYLKRLNAHAKRLDELAKANKFTLKKAEDN